MITNIPLILRKIDGKNLKTGMVLYSTAVVNMFNVLRKMFSVFSYPLVLLCIPLHL